MTKANPKLYRAYLLKEDLRLALKAGPDEIASALTKWMGWAQRCRIPVFRDLRKKIKRHFAAIVSVARFKFSNARSEAANNKIKLIIRTALASTMLTIWSLRSRLPALLAGLRCRGADLFPFSHTNYRSTKKLPLHVVSAFCAECELVLEQLACEKKSNEITAIPKLLELLELKGCIVTIDVMGTQTEIAKKITEKGVDYILALKENQKTLYEDVRLFFEEYRTRLDSDCCAASHSQGHGRYETRTCCICRDIDWLEGREKWSGLAGIGVIFCRVEHDGKLSKQAHYFIFSSKNMTATRLLTAKRSHWGIENKLHWVLDMQFREDENRARTDNSAENFNVLRHWAYNLLKAETSVRGSSLRHGRKFCDLSG